MLVTMDDCGELSAFTATSPKLKLAGLRLIASPPVPLSAMVCGLFAALSLIETCPLSALLLVGANVTVTLHCAPAARLEPHVFV